MVKKLLFTVICILTLCFPMAAWANANISIIVNGEKVNFVDQKPYIDSNSRTMVPIRFISESLNAEVDWVEKERKVVVKKQGVEISLVVGMKTAKVNNKEIKLDTSSVIVGGRTFVPLRFIGEAFGASVGWDDKSKVVTITTESSSGNETGKMPESSYYNELYNLFTFVPKGMKGSAIEQFAHYTFKEDGTVNNLNFTEENMFKGQSLLELSKGGVIFSPYNLETVDSFSVQIFKNVTRTNKQLIGQYIYFSDLKPEDLMVIEKSGFTFVTTKGFRPYQIKETGYNLMNKKLFIYNDRNLYVFSFIYDPMEIKYLNEDIMDSIINSIEINGTKINLKKSSTSGKNATVEDILLSKATYTKKMTLKENEARLIKKYFPQGFDLSNLVRIEGGTFIDDNGKKITVKPFYVSKNLVTIREWNSLSKNKIDIKQYNSKYNLNIKSEDYPAVFETQEKYGTVEIKNSLDLYMFCNEKSKSQGIEEYYSFKKNNYGTSTIFEHNGGFRLLSEEELKYILRKTKSEAYKNNVKSNSISEVGQSSKNELGIFDYDSNVAEVTDFDSVLKIKDSSQMICGFRYARDIENSVQELILDFFSN
ncbi:copper amine oxidase N-terminal domain-containing protein [Acetivibrio mesophilus]|uniref:Copper amine oxidase n=1 Tax=Acetivibrio mesophilus TaxID=2487273 RepID=A0A4Q0I733_9FIRM|nr:copper amine oxidase N-terminal domain-containing protein [Acetivibrio mesophilus]RXE59665.1 copper amine oxidase [Acetivibrio mesophilus]